MTLPLFVRKFVVDFVETATPALLGLTVAGDRDAAIHAALVAVGAAAVSAARRATPEFFAFVRERVGYPPAE